MSLMPRSRLIWDSTRSPSVQVRTSTRPHSAPTHGDLPAKKVADRIAAVIPQANEPANPSQDLFGLIVGTIGCLPKSTPTVEPPTSDATTVSIRQNTRPAPSCG